MNVHGWVRHEVEQSLQQARERGFAPGLGLRALLSAVVLRSSCEREVADLAAELQFLAENLDERDFAFMRP